MREVFKALGVDQGRLRDRRVECHFMSYLERWRLSDKYDLEWIAKAPDVCWPIDDDTYEIWSVRVVPRKQGL